MSKTLKLRVNNRISNVLKVGRTNGRTIFVAIFLLLALGRMRVSKRLDDFAENCCCCFIICQERSENMEGTLIALLVFSTILLGATFQIEADLEYDFEQVFDSIKFRLTVPFMGTNSSRAVGSEKTTS